ncbi:MAG: glutamate racemase [Thermanaerothrix sp.]|nr:glutamate racemase [Thermanaerothrix sp.]
MGAKAETALIGVFDSGVGGLSVLRAIRALLPQHPVVYLADQAHVPYGPRPLEEVRGFAEAITRFLLGQGARVIVVACNTASAAALYDLRAMFPEVPFVGMEPAVKPAAEQTQTGRVGVLATPATFQGALYASVVERFASHVRLYQDTCPGLVEAIEAGNLDGETPRQILERALRPMLAEGIDTVVLGCTHYPFVIPLIQSIVGPEVRVIDPAPAVARQTQRVLDLRGWLAPPGQAGMMRFLTSGAVERFRSQVQRLLGEHDAVVEQVVWSGGEVKLVASTAVVTPRP